MLGQNGMGSNISREPRNPPQDGRQLVLCSMRSQMKNFFVKAVKASKLSANLWVENTCGGGFRKRQLLWRPMTVPICCVSLRDFPHTRAQGTPRRTRLHRAVHGGITRRPVSQKERGGPRDRPLQRPASRQEASGTILPVRATRSSTGGYLGGFIPSISPLDGVHSAQQGRTMPRR